MQDKGNWTVGLTAKLEMSWLTLSLSPPTVPLSWWKAASWWASQSWTWRSWAKKRGQFSTGLRRVCLKVGVKKILLINWPCLFGTNDQRSCVDSAHCYVENPGFRASLLKLLFKPTSQKNWLFFYKPEWKAISLVVLPLGHWCGNPAFGRSPTDGQNEVVFVYWKK